MGDYKEMSRAVAVKSLSIVQGVRSIIANLEQEFRSIIGGTPIVEVNSHSSHENCHQFKIATYGAGIYKQVAQFSLAEMPGCCGIIVFYHASIATDFREKGLGSLLLQVRERAGILAGYSMAQATVLRDNEPELSILNKSGWMSFTVFPNDRTGNQVVILTKTLNRT